MPGSCPASLFDVAIRSLGEPAAEVLVLNASIPSRPTSTFNSPAGVPELADLLARLDQHADRDLHSGGAMPPAFQALAPQAAGGALFRALFQGDVARLLDHELSHVAACAPAATLGSRLRIRLFFDPCLADVAALPWELLYHPGRREFLGRSPTMALSRCLPAERLVQPLPVRLPLKVVVAGPAPLGMNHLELARELDSLRRGLAAYPAVEVIDLQPPTFEQLLEVLGRDPGIHLFHFMGHGSFVPATGEGALVFVDSQGEARLVPGDVLSGHLPGSVRLAVLNSCNSGSVPRQRGRDPFSGVATALLLAGLPAVIAMQLAISDQAALAFSAKLYSRLAQGDPVDVAATRGRQAVFDRAPRSLEWIKPVVFMQVADGQVLLPEEPPRREVGIALFVGNAAVEAEALERVVRDLAPKLEPLGLSLRSRRAPLDAPEATVDGAELCIGLWTARSSPRDAMQEPSAVRLSGWVAAPDRGPWIVFHGKALEASPDSWPPSLAELRWRRPELFCSFADLADLAAKFRRLLLQQLFAAAGEPSAHAPAPLTPPWAAALARRVDAAAGPPSYLDRPARRVPDRIARLGRLSALPGALTAAEAEVLLAAAYLRALAAVGGREAERVHTPPAEIAGNLRGELGWEPRFAAAAASAAAAAEREAGVYAPELRTGPWRLDLIAALLRLSELLDLDHGAVLPGCAGRMPEPGEALAAWLAYLTREVRIAAGGIVQFALTVPAVEWIEPLKRATSLRVEAAWQELRMILLAAGVTVAVAPSEVLLSADGPVPAVVLEKLRRFGAEVRLTALDLNHLAEQEDGLPSLDLLLPLPCAAVDAEEKLVRTAEGPALLELVDETTGEVIARRRIAAGEREVVFDLEDLRPDRWVRWSLHSEIIAGEKHLERVGRLRPLAPAQQRLWQAAGAGSDSDTEPWRLLLALGLHSRLLRQLAPRLVSGEASPTEMAIAHQLCVDAYLWTLHAAPNCPLVENYRQAAHWAASRLPLQGGTIS